MTAAEKPSPTITENALAEMVRTALGMANPPDPLRLVVWRKNPDRTIPETVQLWGRVGPRSSVDVPLRVLYRTSHEVALLGAFRLADIVLWYRQKRPGLLECDAAETVARI